MSCPNALWQPKRQYVCMAFQKTYKPLFPFDLFFTLKLFGKLLATARRHLSCPKSVLTVPEKLSAISKNVERGWLRYEVEGLVSSPIYLLFLEQMIIVFASRTIPVWSDVHQNTSKS
jgi:hypothetical protein